MTRPCIHPVERLRVVGEPPVAHWCAECGAIACAEQRMERAMARPTGRRFVWPAREDFNQQEGLEG